MGREDFNGIVGGSLTEATYEFSRPADTNAYLTNDVVSDSTTAPNPIIFSGIGRVAGGGGYITKLTLNTNAAQAPQYRLWLFNTAPSGIPDNTGYALLYAERASRIGYIDASSQISGATVYNIGSTYINDSVRLAYKCTATGQHLYGILQTTSGFTPSNAQSFSLKLTADQN